MRFVTLFPETQNVHLIKDVGMIPYVMYKEFNFESVIVCYQNDNYEYLETEVKGLKIDFLKKYSRKSVINGVIYLIKNSKKIDVLQLYHYVKRTKVWIILYKILNPKGKVYLKLDATIEIKKIKFDKLSLINHINTTVLKKCDLVSAETKEFVTFLNENWPVTVQYIPNGFYKESLDLFINYSTKDNIICTVGRIGAPEKANHLLVEAFLVVHKLLPKWELKLIGPIDNEFREYIAKYFSGNTELMKKVIFTGAINDRKKLKEEYKKAKIFCLTSLSEGFPLVFLEAIESGCYIISSDLPAAHDITNEGKYGDIFEINNKERLSKLILEACNNEERLSSICTEVQEYANNNYNWVKICSQIINILKINEYEKI